MDSFERAVWDINFLSKSCRAKWQENITLGCTVQTYPETE